MIVHPDLIIDYEKGTYSLECPICRAYMRPLYGENREEGTRFLFYQCREDLGHASQPIEVSGSWPLSN